MDLQMKLAADGLAMTYKSPEIAALPAWAHWKDSVYATTFEPIAIVYNKRLVPPEDVPKTHADFVKLLTTKADKYQKKVTTYDAEKSGVVNDQVELPGTGGPALPLDESGLAALSGKMNQLETKMRAYESVLRERGYTPSVWPVVGKLESGFGGRRNPFGGSSNPEGSSSLTYSPFLFLILSFSGLKVRSSAIANAVTISGEATKACVDASPSLRRAKFLLNEVMIEFFRLGSSI